MNKEAILYEKLPNKKVRCTACARYCEMADGQIGLCGIRGNENGKLDLFVYGKVIAGHVDPIEKNQSFITILDLRYFLLPQLDVIGFVNIVRIMISVKEGKLRVQI